MVKHESQKAYTRVNDARPAAPAPGATSRAVDVATAARTLGVSEYLVRRMIDDGSLRAIRLGRLLRIPSSALDELLAK